MKLKQYLVGLIAVLALSQALAADPSMHQVYEAAEAGHLPQAQQMMREVLKAHPNSAKAHYVEAELLSRQHDLADARSELATAERLSPGLAFADTKSVRELREALAQTPAASPALTYAQPATNSGNSFPWGIVLVIVAVIAFVVFMVRLLATRTVQTVVPGATAYGGGYAAPQPMGPYGPYGGAPAAATGGSGILGSLATGAAIGAGVVAGEALMDRILDGRHEHQADRLVDTSPGYSDPDASINNDMGGQDFGISDTGWDDQNSASDPSDDWS